MSLTVEKPSATTSALDTGRWMTVIFNNEITPYDAVIAVLIRATGCDLREAATETWEAHNFGKAPVHFADQIECERVAQIISAIGVQTHVSPEWSD